LQTFGVIPVSILYMAIHREVKRGYMLYIHPKPDARYLILSP